MAPSYGWVSTASRQEPIRGGSLLLTTKFQEIPGTHFTYLERMKAEPTLELHSAFELGIPLLGNLNH